MSDSGGGAGAPSTAPVAAAPTPALNSSAPSTSSASAFESAPSASSSSSLRPDLITSAISFLSDPKVQASSLSQRVAFLESKGLSSLEIDEAMRQVTGLVPTNQAAVQPYYQPQPQQQQQQYYASQAPPPPPRPYYGSPAYANNMAAARAAAAQKQGLDWRDWFIMTVVTGTVGYGIISLAKRYLFPHLQPPNATALEADLQRLNAKYDEVEAALASIDEETQAIRNGVDEQRADVERSVAAIDKALEQLQEGERRRDEDMKAVKREVDRMKDELPGLFTKTKEAQSASLQDLQSELKSLKALLVSRNGPAAQPPPSPSAIPVPTNGAPARSYSPAPPTNGYPHAGAAAAPAAPASPSVSSHTGGPPLFSSKPSIPAWQLAGGSGSTGAAAASASSGNSGSSAPTASATPINANTTSDGSTASAGSSSATSHFAADGLAKSSTSESSE
ncbi:peroxisomal membrane protein pex14 [Tilletia horrida]|uniref:Peroxisomal membrane protein PEX14 n=1 Tax=Tilletia horrida TaxID=155126 RepID=A0AAN6JZS1_9BASI|nr:peroxisomal membrane protein pex14 [Tilletia horrida]KAK0568879.1 peroxisomal membrane protein pex14 [Tilletia horrida]